MIRTILRWVTQSVSLRWGDRFITHLPKFLTHGEVVTSYNNVSLGLNTGEEIGKRIYYYGAYEPEQERTIIEFFHQGTKFFDVGANIGLYSILAAQRGSKVFAFEPSRKVGKMLIENIKRNRQADKIIVIPKAMADKAGALEFFETRPGNVGVGRVFNFNAPADWERYKVQVGTLDQFVQEHGVPDVIKIDIEGAEWLVLNGSQETLSKNSPTILIEFHPKEIEVLGGTVQKCIDIISSYGYFPQLPNAISDQKHSWQVYKKEPPLQAQ